jgi:ABC-type Fe3+/spermidine/putrescine transport system ATPase subunit
MTTVVVTHDQDEAMSLADSIIVMNAGRILQQGPPMDVYARPQSRFVAEFVGASNWFRGRLGAERTNGIYDFKIAGGPEIRVSKPAHSLSGGDVHVCLRPERTQIRGVLEEATHADANTLRGRLRDIAPLGANISFIVELAFGTQVEVVDKNLGPSRFKPGDDVVIGFLPDDCIVVKSDV